MASVLVDLIPSAIGLALTPAAIAAGILLLSSARPVANATALAFALVYAGISAAVLAVAASSSGPLLSERTKSLIEIGVGGLLIALAAGTMLRGRAGQHKPSRLLGNLDRVRPRQAFGLGPVLATLNPNVPILIAGLAVIGAADLTTAGRIVGVIFLVAASQLGLAGPILWYLAHPERAARGLGRLRTWIGQYESVSSSSSAWRSSPKESPASRGFEASEPADARSSPEARDGPQSRHGIVARQANART